jgi:hypothetical protein
MNVKKTTGFKMALVSMSVVHLLSGCAPGAKSAHDHDKLVPERTQRESERNMTEQQVMMQDLNSTPSERAGAAHDLQRDSRHDRQNDNQDE